MIRQALGGGGARIALQPWRTISFRTSSSDISSAVNSSLLRSLKQHFLEVSKMTPPPKVSPPAPFAVVKGSLDRDTPILKRTHNNEVISVYVMRLRDIIPAGGKFEDGGGSDGINQVFLHVDISKPGKKDSLHFLCSLYPDALDIHSVSMMPKHEALRFFNGSTKYNGPVFESLNSRMRDALHNYIEKRGINDSLFPFLQAWLYVKDHRNLTHWFRSLAELIDDGEQASIA